jgi:hypothetical protein
MGLLASAAEPATGASTPLPCHAAMSSAHPTEYSTTDVEVVTTPLAAITTVAAYKTKATPHSTVASKLGKATIAYKISDATAGFVVKVTVSVKLGARAGTCSTSFTPVK